MKATTLNRIAWAALVITLAVYTLSEGWDAVTTWCTIAGHTMICTALYIASNNYFKEKED